ncbi:BRCT domain-containing protein, partial [Planctomycetota bacterium]
YKYLLRKNSLEGHVMARRRRRKSVRRPQQQEGPSENLKVVAIIFIATTVVGIGASFLLYSEIREMEDIVAKVKAERAAIRVQYERELTRAENLAEKILGNKEGTADGLDKVLKPVIIEIEKEAGEAAEELGVDEAEWKPLCLVDLIVKVRNKAISIKEENEVHKTQIEEQKKEYKKKEEELNDLRDKKEQEIVSVRTDLANERGLLRRTTDEFEEKIALLQQGNRDLRKKIEDMTRAHREEIEQKNVEMENAKDQIERLKRIPKAITAIFEFDGAVLQSNTKLGVATINLGRIDGIRPGFLFEIYPPGVPSEDEVKAKVEVKKVHPHTSTVRILEEKITDPILSSDQIYSPFYNPLKREAFTLIGDFESPFTEDRVMKLVKEHGGTASREITDETDYVVLGKSYEHDQNYESAVRLGIEVLRIKTLQRFFGRR